MTTIPYVESRHKGGKQKPTAILLSTSFTTSEEGAALGLAYAWHSSTSPVNPGHYVVDGESVYRCTYDNVVAGDSRFTDKGAIRIIICAEPVSRTEFWDTEVHRKVLRRTAGLVADLALAYNIRIRYLDESGKNSWDKLKWRRRGGIILDVPDGWPADTFLDEVETHIVFKTFN